MATINFATREISAKVVYFGASKAGTTTCVRHLHQRLTATEPSRLHTFGPSATEQILYFEYVPGERPRFGGFDLRVQVYALSGSVRRRTHREEVLAGTDAVVFVADARRSRAQANVDAIVRLEDALEEHEVTLERMPVVIVVNHLDDDEARSESDVGLDLNTYGFPLLAAVARDGRGVLEAQGVVLDRLTLQLRANLAGEAAGVRIEAVHDPDAERDDEVVQRHVAAIASRSLEIESVRPAFDDLPPGPVVKLPVKSADLQGLKPVHLRDHDIEGTALVLDLVLEDPSGNPSRASIHLDPMVKVASPTRTESGVSQYLPDEPDPEEQDLPPWAYGAIGLGGGALIGLLLGYVSGLT